MIGWGKALRKALILTVSEIRIGTYNVYGIRHSYRKEYDRDHRTDHRQGDAQKPHDTERPYKGERNDQKNCYHMKDSSENQIQKEGGYENAEREQDTKIRSHCPVDKVGMGCRPGHGRAHRRITIDAIHQTGDFVEHTRTIRVGIEPQHNTKSLFIVADEYVRKFPILSDAFSYCLLRCIVRSDHRSRGKPEKASGARNLQTADMGGTDDPLLPLYLDFVELIGPNGNRIDFRPKRPVLEFGDEQNGERDRENLLNPLVINLLLERVRHRFHGIVIDFEFGEIIAEKSDRGDHCQ